MNRSKYQRIHDFSAPGWKISVHGESNEHKTILEEWSNNKLIEKITHKSKMIINVS